MSDVCPKCRASRCPVCGSKLVPLVYEGIVPDRLAMMESPDFRGFRGCIRVELHDKVVNGFNYRGLAFIEAVFRGCKEK